MPSAAFHSNYWATTAGGSNNDPIGGGTAGGFVSWQTVIIERSGFGMAVVTWAWVLLQQ